MRSAKRQRRKHKAPSGGHWVHFFRVPNGVSPSNEFLVYTVTNPVFPSGSGGADFYVDNAEVVGPSADGVFPLECVDATPATPGI